MLVPVVVLFVTVLSLSAASVEPDILGSLSLLPLILHCSEPWSEDKEGLCPDACRRWPQYCYYAIAAENGVPGTCALPHYPRIGSYSIADIAHTGELADFTLRYSCPPDYNLHGEHPRCVGGGWSTSFPSCERDLKCTLPSDPSVHFNCDSSSGKCPNKSVGSGQRVFPECRPGFVDDELRPMLCVDGSWNYVATCRRECGTIPSSKQLKRATDRSEAPWHAIVYDKTGEPYKQLCGGSLISPKFIISAAHCFWSDKDQRTKPAKDYAVAVGTVYKIWRYDGSQKADVSDIKIPPHFRGPTNSFQSDISLVTLNSSIVFNNEVRPVCVDFSVTFDEQQLQPANVGKIAVWTLTPVLKVVSMSYVDVDQCFADLPVSFRSYMTSDKICAITINTALCLGDSGGGLAFPRTERGAPRWYLRDVTSTAPAGDEACSPSAYTAFTHVLKHEGFITKYVEGKRDYVNEIYLIP